MEKAKKVILDTNVISVLYGAYIAIEKKSNEQFKNFAIYKKYLELVDEGRLTIYITPQILTEFLHCKGTNPQVTERFDAFLTKYTTLIKFNKEQRQKIAKITYELGNTIFTKNNKFTNESVEFLLFNFAAKRGDRNFADATIMAESMVSGIELVTNNTKDFAKFTFVNKLATKYELHSGVFNVSKDGRYLQKNFPEYNRMVSTKKLTKKERNDQEKEEKFKTKFKSNIDYSNKSKKKEIHEKKKKRMNEKYERKNLRNIEINY